MKMKMFSRKPRVLATFSAIRGPQATLVRFPIMARQAAKPKVGERRQLLDDNGEPSEMSPTARDEAQRQRWHMEAVAAHRRGPNCGDYLLVLFCCCLLPICFIWPLFQLHALAPIGGQDGKALVLGSVAMTAVADAGALVKSARQAAAYLRTGTIPVGERAAGTPPNWYCHASTPCNPDLHSNPKSRIPRRLLFNDSADTPYRSNIARMIRLIGWPNIFYNNSECKAILETHGMDGHFARYIIPPPPPASQQHAPEHPSPQHREKDGRFKSDMCRLAMLHRHGGWYLDSDLYPTRADFASFAPPWATLVSSNTTMEGSVNAPGLFNAILGASKAHPVVAQAIENHRRWYEHRTPTETYRVTRGVKKPNVGTVLLKDAADTACSKLPSGKCFFFQEQSTGMIYHWAKHCRYGVFAGRACLETLASRNRPRYITACA